MLKRNLPIEVWFALGGLFLGLAFLFYRPSTPIDTRDQGPLPSTGDSSGAAETDSGASSGAPVTLGAPVVINQASSPSVKSPEADPLLPPTSPQLDAVLGLKYYLLSDADKQAVELFDAIPIASRDLVLRSALYAVWERGESGKGDWFMGSVADPYTSRDSAMQLGNDPAHNIDTADAPVTNEKLASESELALARIGLCRQLLTRVDAKTQAYWMPYLVIKLRRLHSESRQPIIDNLIAQLSKEGNKAIAQSLKDYEVESKVNGRWTWATQKFNMVFPLVLSALGFILAKISQSTLAAVDRWIGARWTKPEPK